jgi:hypothetical protein
MATVKLVKSIYTGSDVTSLGELASGDNPDLGTPASGILTNCTGLPLTGLVATAFTTPSFNAGDYTATESQTWTVAEADVVTNKYLVIGKMMIWEFFIDTTTVGGTPSYGLLLKVPGSKTITNTSYIPVRVSDNGTPSNGTAYLVASATTVRIMKSDESNWAAATNTTIVSGTLVFEIN